VPFVLPQTFPVAALAPSRAFYWVHDRDPELAKSLARAVFAGYFGEGRNVCLPNCVADLGESVGIDRNELLAALDDSTLKERLKNETSAAIERGVFGSPFIFIDGEPFWGNDRIDQVDRWLETGGW
jgi:2-hydroxychromene-2-carboxylate isomerase